MPARYVTFFIARVACRERRLTYANAGHNPPLLLGRHGDAQRLLEGGPVLGVFPDRKYTGGERVLRPGDLLVLYTDGYTEATNRAGAELGERRLVETLAKTRGATAEGVVAALLDELDRFRHGACRDDVTLLVASFGEPSID